MKKNTPTGMETEVMSILTHFTTNIHVKEHVLSPQIVFYGREQISLDISWFLQRRFSLVYLIAKSKYFEGIAVDDIEQEMKIISMLEKHRNLPHQEVAELIEQLIQLSKIFQNRLINDWSKNVHSELARDLTVSLSTLRQLIIDNDNSMCIYLTNSALSRHELVEFLIDFHFSHPYLDQLSCKKLKISFHEIMSYQSQLAIRKFNDLRLY
ncbi:MAG: hypothetical protein ACRCVV_06460 [Shewanella sp.]